MLKCRFADDDDVDDSATMIAQLDKSSQIGPIGQNFFIFLYRWQALMKHCSFEKENYG